MEKVIFIDRDGTLIVEPPVTRQVNSLEEMTFIPNVISSLKKLYKNGYTLVMVTNQDGLGTPSNPTDNYELINRKMFEVFEGEGIKFSQVLECPHFPADNCNCRKPKTGLMNNLNYAFDKNNSFMVGDRNTDIEFANNIGIKSFLLSENLNWLDITKSILSQERKAEVSRKTNETDINVSINLDGSGKYDIDTGLKFFDHMLEQLAKHSNYDLKILCKGDLQIDEHHTIEDVALALGEAFKQALGDKRGIERFAWDRILVMDEARTEVSLDLSGRPLLQFEAKFDKEYVGDFPCEMLEHFFQSLSYSSGMNIYVKIEGKNTHHQIESCFKALARTLKDATKITSTQISSTKGVL